MYIFFYMHIHTGEEVRYMYIYLSRIHAHSKKNKWYVYILFQEECVDLILQAKSYSMFSLAEIKGPRVARRDRQHWKFINNCNEQL